MNRPDFGDLSLPASPAQTGTEKYDPIVGQVPIWHNGYANAEHRAYHVYHEKARAKAKFALNCVTRLLAHMPVEWGPVKDEADMVDKVEAIMRAPRRFGTFVTKPEVKAVAFAHALRRAKMKKEAAVEKVENLDESGTLEVADEALGAVQP